MNLTQNAHFVIEWNLANSELRNLVVVIKFVQIVDKTNQNV